MPPPLGVLQNSFLTLDKAVDFILQESPIITHYFFDEAQGYAENKYDVKLKAAYEKAVREGK